MKTELDRQKLKELLRIAVFFAALALVVLMLVLIATARADTGVVVMRPGEIKVYACAGGGTFHLIPIHSNQFSAQCGNVKPESKE